VTCQLRDRPPPLIGGYTGLVFTVQGSRALLPTGAGALLTGSSDACIRCWEGAKHDESYMVCGPPKPLDRTSSGLLRFTPSSKLTSLEFVTLSIWVPPFVVGPATAFGQD
jgi:hypothetical protein